MEVSTLPLSRKETNGKNIAINVIGLDLEFWDRHFSITPEEGPAAILSFAGVLDSGPVA